MIIYLIPRVESSDIFRLQKKRDRRERDRRTHIGISILILRGIRTFPPKRFHRSWVSLRSVDRFISHSFLSLALARPRKNFSLSRSRSLVVIDASICISATSGEMTNVAISPGRKLYVSMHIEPRYTAVYPTSFTDTALWHIPVYRPRFFIRWKLYIYTSAHKSIPRSNICNGPCNLSRTSPAGFLSIHSD